VQRLAVKTLLVIAALSVLLSGCRGSEAGPGENLPQRSEPVKLDPQSFTTSIDNPYWPMAPGSRWTYRETDQEGGNQKVVVTVADRVKRVASGVTARVVRDTVIEDGKLVEDTFDWYAQDKEGNVWYLGEDTAEFENGKVSTKEGSFEAGVKGAQAGIIMPARPKTGMRFRQEYLKGQAEDKGEILSTDEMAEVPFGHFRNALLTKDTVGIEPNVLEYKLYVKGLGPVLTLGVSGGPGSREELIKRDMATEKEADRAGTIPLGKRY